MYLRRIVMRRLPSLESGHWKPLNKGLVLEDHDCPLRYPAGQATVSMDAAEPVGYPSRWRRFVIAWVDGSYYLEIGLEGRDCTRIDHRPYATQAKAYDAFRAFFDHKRADEIVEDANDELAGLDCQLKSTELVWS
jgi:hypothetical protein